MSSSDLHFATGHTRRELARRANCGVEVMLVWAEDTNAVAVHVRDDRTLESFELVVESGVNPLEVFQHPYA
jgi:hypothetical protein